MFQTQRSIEKETKKTDRHTHKQTDRQTEREAKEKHIYTTCRSAKRRTISTSALEQPRSLLPTTLALCIRVSKLGTPCCIIMAVTLLYLGKPKNTFKHFTYADESLEMAYEK